MKRTSWLVLATVALIGGGFGLLTQWLLVSRGFSALVIPLTLSSVCVVLGAILVGLAWPIRQRLYSETSRPRIDPLYSVRVVLLAKASSLTGSLLGGTGLVSSVLRSPDLSSTRSMRGWQEGESSAQ